MNFFDEARSISNMLKMRNMTQSRLSELLGVSQPYIANKVRLLKLPLPIQERITEAHLTERHARCLLRLPPELRDEALDTVIGGRMTVAECDAVVDRLLDKKEPAGIELFSPTETLHRLEDDIERALSTFRLFGISASVKRELFGGKTYINVKIG
ncbi:MAG: hypothetical protein IJY01_00955 [Clostridia bacterium]|nr:hypothetical protein [Clostridia bacterium]MBQ8289425.1 hypothetical protein [Clostridia bacterium]